MEKQVVEFSGTSMPLYSVNTLIVGSGAAALSAAVKLFELEQKDIAIATQRWGGGTSNNAGSDKQTYYKLSLGGDIPDSPLQMAEDLFNGKCMHGDIALCEAQNSLPAFFNLVRLGVPFPHDRYGAYAGYKTDHDPRARATSAGPLTSHLMFDALAGEVKRKGIPVLDHHEVIALLTETKGDEKHVIGAVALDLDNLDSENYGFVVFNAKNVVLGTGGPGGMYEASVYPESQSGSTGMAFEIGAVGQNLTESQVGLASVSFRWNLSGTYQQVIPRYISTDRNGGDETEFLNEFFPDMGALASAIFLKGYQWPFDPGRIAGYGSSLIDLLVYRETVIKKRRVFLDFKNNPTGSGILEDFSFDLLSQEARDYLEKSGALFGTPIERLQKMNPLAVKLYKDHNIDLSGEYLEIAVCAQHNNGGLKGNTWWESNIKHLFPVGEVNGSHGVYRPGGSALNAGQVGGLRSALYISKKYKGNSMDVSTFISRVGERIKEKFNFASRIIDNNLKDNQYMHTTRKAIRQRMSYYGAQVRDPRKIKEAVSEARQLYSRMKSRMKIPSSRDLPAAFKNLDLCLTHAVYLEAIVEYLEKGGKSRGSYLVVDAEGEKPCEKLENEWRFSLNRDDAFVNRKILEISLDESLSVKKKWVDIRPIPREEQWFENLWEDYREGKIFE
jgi:succinate dehydrogenase/fumarate reductase flavoprotein subunit